MDRDDPQLVVAGWMSADEIAAIATAGTLALSLLIAFASLAIGAWDRHAKRQATKMEQAKAFAHLEVDEHTVSWSVTNASPFPIRQVRAFARPFVTTETGKKWAGNAVRNAEFPESYIPAGATVMGPVPRTAYQSELLPWADYGVVLHFIDYEQNHWVRQANGKVVPIEKLKGTGFNEFPRTLYEPDKPHGLFRALRQSIRRLVPQPKG